MENIIKELQNFHFTKIEAQIYLCLLQNEELNGSQVAKFLNLPRTSVYTALESLYQKGVVLMLPGEPTLYKVQDPSMFVGSLKKEYTKSIETLEKSLINFKSFGAEDQYWNIKGYENFLLNVKKMLSDAQKEVYISTNYDLQLFKEELSLLKERNVRVIVFSFEALEVRNLSIEFYHYENKKVCLEDKRMMLVIDQQKVLVAHQNVHGEVLGTITQNPLLITIISEHIHHDIYLLKLNQKYEKDLVTKKIQLDSQFERNSKICSSK